MEHRHGQSLGRGLVELGIPIAFCILRKYASGTVVLGKDASDAHSAVAEWRPFLDSSRKRDLRFEPGTPNLVGRPIANLPGESL